MLAKRIGEDVAALIRVLVEHQVRFMLVGGQAVIYHGYPRLTGDVDLWFQQTPTNVDRLWQALDEFWMQNIPGLVGAHELLEPEVIVMFGRSPNRVDLLSTMDGVEFDTAWSGRIEATLATEKSTVTLAVIGLPDLLANKRATGRHRDLEDVEHLESAG